jgi:hypothetical protein
MTTTTTTNDSGNAELFDHELQMRAPFTGEDPRGSRQRFEEELGRRYSPGSSELRGGRPA